MVPSIAIELVYYESPPLAAAGAFVVSAFGVTSTGRHPDGAIKPDDLAVEHRVFDDVDREPVRSVPHRDGCGTAASDSPGG